MSVSQNRTKALWGSFMPRRQEITNPLSTDFYAVQCYGPNYFTVFDPHSEFVKWAAMEVAHNTPIPKGMGQLILPSGSYAVFQYTGHSEDPTIFQYVYGEWLPNSGWRLDQRPHFELLGKNYKNQDPLSEEEIWIPIQ